MITHRVEPFTPPAEGELVVVQVIDRAVAVTVVDGQLYAFDDL